MTIKPLIPEPADTDDIEAGFYGPETVEEHLARMSQIWEHLQSLGKTMLKTKDWREKWTNTQTNSDDA